MLTYPSSSAGSWRCQTPRTQARRDLVEFSLEQQAFGQICVANEMRKDLRRGPIYLVRQQFLSAGSRIRIIVHTMWV
jgi:hypothetical protein